jgi:hypothetical protein
MVTFERHILMVIAFVVAGPATTAVPGAEVDHFNSSIDKAVSRDRSRDESDSDLQQACILSSLENEEESAPTDSKSLVNHFAFGLLHRVAISSNSVIERDQPIRRVRIVRIAPKQSPPTA